MLELQIAAFISRLNYFFVTSQFQCATIPSRYCTIIKLELEACDYRKFFYACLTKFKNSARHAKYFTSLSSVTLPAPFPYASELQV